MAAPTETPAAKPPHRIPPPTGERIPLKANVFEKMQSANTQLLPLFPYMGVDAIVPCGATFCGGPYEFGRFFHSNPLDEIVLAFGTDGGNIQPGDVHVLAKTHAVHPYLKNPTSPDSFLLIAITQRESTEVPGYGREAVTFRCSQCSEELVQLDFAAAALPPRAERGPDADPYPAFTTLVGTLDAANLYNGDEAQRACKKCGIVNAPFPVDLWGLRAYVQQCRTGNAARRALDAAARDALQAKS
jgi:hypothetical protein